MNHEILKLHIIKIYISNKNKNKNIYIITKSYSNNNELYLNTINVVNKELLNIELYIIQWIINQIYIIL